MKINLFLFFKLTVSTLVFRKNNIQNDLYYIFDYIGHICQRLTGLQNLLNHQRSHSEFAISRRNIRILYRFDINHKHVRILHSYIA